MSTYSAQMGEMSERQKRAMAEATKAEPRAKPKAEARPKPAAGWYAHPTMVDTQRYWDGDAWTDHIAPGKPRGGAAPGHVGAQGEQNTTGLQVTGVLTAIFLPIIGFIIGIVLLAKNKTGPGLGCMVIAIIAFFFWYEALTPDPTYSDLYYQDPYP